VPAEPLTAEWELVGGIRVRCTGRNDGDMVSERDDGDRVSERAGSAERRHAVMARTWTVPRQVHGAAVIAVAEPGGGAGHPADGLVTARDDVAIAVLTGDCAPVALASPEGVAGVAHAGWRGLYAGIIEATVEAMRALGATTVEALLGPCIHPECYAFGAEDLDRVADRFGESVRATDRDGHPALDIPAGVAIALQRCDATLAVDVGICTACGADHWSWRARQDTARQATVVWRS
jgi:polyphenol oxidase